MDVEQQITKDDSSEDEGIVVRKKSVKLQILDSDEEAVTDYGQNAPESDFEEEETFLNVGKPRKSRVLHNTESDSENETSSDRKAVCTPKNVDENPHKPADCYALFREKEDLYDADGSEDEVNRMSDSEQYSEPKKSKGRNSLNGPKQERKSKTKAKSVMQQIHSETQRLVRESPISLPYHRPRQRTLTEFLQRHKPISVNGTSARLSLNLPEEKLTEVWKQLEEREKEAEEFYKSESEDSEKESEVQKNEERQDQQNGVADSSGYSSQTPVEEQREGNETIDSLQTKVTNIGISCDATVISVDTDKSDCMEEASKMNKDSMHLNTEFQKPLTGEVSEMSKDSMHLNGDFQKPLIGEVSEMSKDSMHLNTEFQKPLIGEVSEMSKDSMHLNGDFQKPLTGEVSEMSKDSMHINGDFQKPLTGEVSEMSKDSMHLNGDFQKPLTGEVSEMSKDSMHLNGDFQKPLIGEVSEMSKDSMHLNGDFQKPLTGEVSEMSKESMHLNGDFQKPLTGEVSDMSKDSMHLNGDFQKPLIGEVSEMSKDSMHLNGDFQKPLTGEVSDMSKDSMHLNGDFQKPLVGEVSEMNKDSRQPNVDFQKPHLEVSVMDKDSMQLSAVFQKPVLKSKEVIHSNAGDDSGVPSFSSENAKSNFIGIKEVETTHSFKINNSGLNNKEVDIPGRAKSTTNNISAFYLENSEAQFNLFSSCTKNSENDKTFLNNSKEKAQGIHTETLNPQSNGRSLNFLHPKEANRSLESINQNTLKKTDIDKELHAEMINASRSMGTQDFVLHWSETESMDTTDVPQKTTSLLDTQRESREGNKDSTAVSSEGTSPTNQANNATHSTSNTVAGSYTQNFHLHYSESISWDNDNEGADETGKCVLPPEADEENAVDISLHRKENSLIKEAKEVKDNRDTSKEENIDSVQEAKKQNVEWWHNIQPPSDDSDNEEKFTENKKLLSIAKNSFPGLGDITKLQPRLSDTPNGIIDLDEDVTDKSGVVKFVQRFMKHSAASVKKKPTTRTKEISVVSAEKNAEGLETVQKDVMTVLLEDDEPVEDPALAKPGAKLQRLKKELQQQMAQKRAEEWQKRQNEQKLDNEELDEAELSDCGAKEEEMEEEMTDRETTESESEDEEEDDVPLVEKKKRKSAFVDEEAEVSEEDGVDEHDEEDEDASMNADDEMDNEDEEENASTRPDNEEEDETTSTNSDKIDKDAESSESSSSKKPKLERVKTFDLFASQDETTQEIQGEQDLQLTSSLIPAYQIARDDTDTPWRTKEDEPKKSVFELISPASDLTPLRSRSNLQSVSQTPLTVTSMSSCDRSPIVTQQKPKRLFTDSEPVSTQEHMDELLGLCSGKFSHSAPDSETGVCGGIEQLVDPVEGSKEELEQELLGLCSGKFTSIQRQDTQLIEASSKLSSEKNSWKSLTIISSDEEDESENLKSRSQRKGIHKKLAFSDEEDEEVEEPADKDSVEGDSENDEDEEEEEEEDDGEKIIEYDSEENEIVVAPEQKKLSRKKMAEYFENEAELSESDWDSADEDERGLNKLEKEEGDDDQLDQEAVKEQLGKIHMRQVLDEDKREVRLLQEILFEDGELHSEGGGRERKFRWKNIDNIDENDLARKDSDDEGVAYDDEEDEAEWRRMRHEREVFLQKLKEKTERINGELLLEDEDSRLLKLGKAALKRIQRCNSQDMSEKPAGLCKSSSAPQLSPDSKHPFKLLTKRGSFLARGESALARIAQMASESINVVSRPKNTRNFVFAALSPGKEDEKSLEEKPVKPLKRCSSEALPPVVKRLKIFDENSRGKKLLDLLS